MTIFAVLFPSPQPAVAGQIVAKYPNDHLRLSETQYLISSRSTVVEVSNSIGVSGPEPFTPTGLAVIFATSSYFGRAPTNVWDWIKVKLEGVPGG
jgi:hypothetical protein